jgi:3-oxoadipate enol-lactonase
MIGAGISVAGGGAGGIASGVMATITVDGAELAYDDQGGGQPVLMLHAGIADRRMWEPVAAELVAGGRRVIRYDLRGYGESSLPDRPFAHHDDTAAVLDTLRIERAVVVGCSFGGAVAIDTALTHPGRVGGLVLVGSAVSGHTWTPEFRATWASLIGEVDDDDLEASAAAEVRFWVVGPERTPDQVDPALLALAHEMDLIALAAETKLDHIEVRELDPPALGRLRDVPVPAWVFAGADDVADIRQLADRLAAEIPRARRLPDVPDAAHLVPLERPEPVAAAVRDFLDWI